MSKEMIGRALKKAACDSKFGNTVLWSLVKDSIEKRHNVFKELPDKHGKVAVVTGGSRGIGLCIVKYLMDCGMTVVVGVRNTDLANKTFEDNTTVGNAVVFELDLSSMRSVRSFTEKVSNEFPVIDLLVNNAGALFKEHKLTEDGFEYHFATNYLGHFLLTHLLLPNLKAAGETHIRVVNVSSCIYNTVKMCFEDIHFIKRHFVFTAAYSQSKLAQLLFTRYLNKKFEKDDINIRVYAVHPGLVHTDMANAEAIRNYARMLPKRWLKSPQDGATPILYACLSPDLEGKGGIYIVNCKENNGTSYSNRENVQEKLFNITCDMLNISSFT